MLKPLYPLLILAAVLFTACSATTPGPTPTVDPPTFIGPVLPTQPAGQNIALPPTEVPSPTPTLAPAYEEYTVRRGDTLGAIADRYKLDMDEIVQFNSMTNPHALQIGQVLKIPIRVDRMGPPDKLIPDSELVYGPGYAHFDVKAVADKYNGYLVGYKERVEGTVMTGPEIIQLVAERFSVGPRILLTILEMQGGWLTSTSLSATQVSYPMGHADGVRTGLYKQAFWMANELNAGYYGTLGGTLPTTLFKDRKRARFAPGLNPGSTAIQNALAGDTTWEDWPNQINEFRQTYQKLFGDPSSYAVEPLVPRDLKQPTLRLPFPDGHLWFFTGGPHAGWVDGSAWAAIDFTPKDQAGSCWTSADWDIAVAPGRIVQTEKGRVVENLSGNDFAGTGWSLLYMHVADEDRVALGAEVKTGDHIGHPSCTGGAAETSHLHFARLYNGQWIPAGDPHVPMVLSGFTVQAAEQEYDGKMARGDKVYTADNAQVPDENGVIADGGK